MLLVELPQYDKIFLLPCAEVLQYCNKVIFSRSDWDAVSTTSSEKENRHREKDDESLDEVVLRRSQRSNSSDISLQPLDKNKENRNTRTKAENDLVALRKKTRKRTRKFVVDGVVVTTRQVIRAQFLVINCLNFYAIL